MSSNVFAPVRFSTMLASDSRNVSRDPTLLFAALMSVVPAIAIYFWRDPINAAAFDAFGLQDIIFYAMPCLLCLPAFLIGWVGGFLFLEDRDDGPLLALEVTPIGKQGFIAYRTSVTMALTFVITFVSAVFILPGQSPAMQLFVAVLIAMEALAAAFILPAVARNKVEGLALTKLTNIGAIVPLVALVPSPLRYVAGIVPTFWLGELLGLSGERALPFWAMATLAIITHAVAAWLLYQLISKKVG